MIAALTSIVMLVLIAAIHGYWMLGGRKGHGAVIPEVNGRSVFHPTAIGTAAVALALLGAAGLIAVQAQLIMTTELRTFARIGAQFLAAVFAARAIGDFRYVGIFKQVKGSRFARLDTWIYSPLCCLLAVLIADVALRH